MAEAKAAAAPLAVRLREVAQAVGRVEKRGRNDHHRYDYVKAEDVVAHVRDLLLERDVIVLPGATNARHEGTLTTADFTFTFMAADTGESLTVPWVGVGFDKGGDKGMNKAATAALKYVLLQTFLIPSGEDPEADRVTNRNAVDAAGTVPIIPVDRARAIADAAVAAGLATPDPDTGLPVPGTVLQARMAQDGVGKFGALNVDQAEGLEAFIAQEAQAAPAKAPARKRATRKGA